MRTLRRGTPKALPLLAILVSFMATLMAGTAGSAEPAQTRKDMVQNSIATYIEYKTAWSGGNYPIRGAGCCENTVFDQLRKDVTVRGDEFVSFADFTVGKDAYVVAYHVRGDFGKPRVVKEVLHTVNGERVNRILWER